jgi:hypothetical protein
MNISAEGNFSVATLKEKFARAGQGKENATVNVGKKHAIENPSEKDKKDVKVEDEDEPLLVENKKRFVLFPIKYHEVRCPTWVTNIIDLANVQESRGVLLDCRGD